MATKKHGGKRKGAGRPVTGRKETVVMRIDAGLLQAVNDLKNGVTANQDGADYLAANEKLTKINDELRTKNIKQGSDNRSLSLKLEKLEDENAKILEAAKIDGIVISKLHNKVENLEQQLQAICAKGKHLESQERNQGTHNYDGNQKDFNAEFAKAVDISTGDKTKLSNKRKAVLAEIGIIPMKNGRLKSDSDRLAVYEWLKSKKNNNKASLQNSDNIDTKK